MRRAEYISTKLCGFTMSIIIMILSVCVIAYANTPILIGTFHGTQGAMPSGTLNIDANGTMYGATKEGGANGYNCGVVWKCMKVQSGNPNVSPHWDIVNISTFTGGPADGYWPVGGATFDSHGNIFGTSANGGYGKGDVWELPAGSSTIVDIGNFNGFNGWTPNAGVTIDSRGNLLGTTMGGGGVNDGVVWEMKRNGNGFDSPTAIAEFHNTNGNGPQGGVNIDSHGNLFGTTCEGGSSSDGVVWEIKASGMYANPPKPDLKVIGTFPGGSEMYPACGVTIDKNDNLYGTASNGAIWAMTQSNGSYGPLTLLVNLTGPNGLYPYAGVVIDGAGDLFGLASQGGAKNAGCVWEIKRSNLNVAIDISDFNQIGNKPICSPAFDQYGNLFGTLFTGGATNDGLLWEVPLVGQGGAGPRASM